MDSDRQKVKVAAAKLRTVLRQASTDGRLTVPPNSMRLSLGRRHQWIHVQSWKIGGQHRITIHATVPKGWDGRHQLLRELNMAAASIQAGIDIELATEAHVDEVDKAEVDRLAESWRD